MAHQGSQPKEDDSLPSLFDELQEDDFPTAEFDVAAFARELEETDGEAAAETMAWFKAGSPDSGVRRSFPTLNHEVGALPNEPEEDTILRCFGCGARILTRQVNESAILEYRLEPRHAYVLTLLDGEASIWDLIERSELTPSQTLFALEELVILGVVA